MTDLEVGTSAQTILDQTWANMVALCSRKSIEEQERYVYCECNYLLRQALSRDDIQDHSQLCIYLEKCHAVIEAHLKKSASYYSQLQWLWYLRRLPLVTFSGELSTTLGYDSTLAETLSAISGRSGDNTQQARPALQYDINRSIVRRVLRFAHGVRFLSRIHGSYRRAGKSQNFTFEGDNPLPVFDTSGATEEAITLYDDRQTMKGRYVSIGRAGTSLSQSFQSDGDFDRSILMVYRLGEETPCPVFLRDKDGSKTDVSVLGRFGPVFEPLLGLKDLNERLGEHIIGIWPPTVLALVYLMRLAIDLIVFGNSSLAKAVEYGYIVTDEKMLKELSHRRHESTKTFLSNIFSLCHYPDSYENVACEIGNLSGSTWPLKAGGIIRRDKGFVCIDLHGATMLLHASLEYPKLAGEIGNIRAIHFEDVVQRCIDETVWQSSGELAKIRQHPLKLSGNAITDIDAIGANEETLLLVSCKSAVSSAKYDKGEYATIRNAATTVIDAVAYWNQKVAFLSEHKNGDNYNFSQFQRIAGIVCTPFAVYVPKGIATAEVLPGIKACCSIDELSQFLTGNI